MVICIDFIWLSWSIGGSVVCVKFTSNRVNSVRSMLELFSTNRVFHFLPRIVFCHNCSVSFVPAIMIINTFLMRSSFPYLVNRSNRIELSSAFFFFFFFFFFFSKHIIMGCLFKQHAAIALAINVLVWFYHGSRPVISCVANVSNQSFIWPTPHLQLCLSVRPFVCCMCACVCVCMCVHAQVV